MIEYFFWVLGMHVDDIVLEKQEAMLPPHIIEEIRKREERDRRRRDNDRPRIRDEPYRPYAPESPGKEEGRGVVIIGPGEDYDGDVYQDNGIDYSV